MGPTMRKLLAVLALCALPGCLIPFDSVKIPASAPAVSVNDPDGIIPKVKDALKNNSKDDVLRAYKIIDGFTLYVKNYNDLPTTTDKLFAKFGEVEDGYGYKTSVSSLNSIIETDLKSLGLDDPKPLAEAKSKIIERFTLYSLGLEQAYASKK